MKLSRKVLAAVLALAMLVGAALTGCGTKALAEPDEVAVAIFDLFMRDDASAITKALGYESEEAARADFLGEGGDLRSELADIVLGEFESMGFSVSEEDTKMFTDAFLTMMGKLEFTAEVKEKSLKDRTAVVTCSVSTLDIEGAMNDAFEAALGDPELLNDTDAAASALVQAMSQAFSNAEPSGETNEFDVDFTLEVLETNGKDQMVWVPEDTGAFGSDLSTAALGG